MGETETNLNRILDKSILKELSLAPAELHYKTKKKVVSLLPDFRGIVHIDDETCDAIQNGSKALASGIVQTEELFTKTRNHIDCQSSRNHYCKD